MILRDLPALAAAVGTAPPCGRPGRSGGVFVDPRLITSYSPRVAWRDAADETHCDDRLFATRVADFACDLPEADPGLVTGRNSDTPPIRNGWQGITHGARRTVARSCCALEAMRKRLAFWTVTLSPAQLDRIEARDTWPEFQNALRHRLARALKARGLRALVIGVVELHPERTRKEGRPCPHLHLCFVNRQHAWGRWILSTADLDLIICKALVAAGCFDLDVRAAGNVQPVKKSVAGYLSHYMKKGSGPWPTESHHSGEGAWRLLPRQWFMQSRPMAELVRMMTVRLPLAFVAFCHERRSHLLEQGWAEHAQVAIPDPRAPAVYSFRWASVGSVAAALAWWQETVWDLWWVGNYRLIHDRAQPGQHPEPDQLV